MILLDATCCSIANHSAPEHARARSWLDDRLNGTAPGLPWPSLLAHPARSQSAGRAAAGPPREGWRQVEAWLHVVRWTAWVVSTRITSARFFQHPG